MKPTMRRVNPVVGLYDHEKSPCLMPSIEATAEAE